MSGAHVAIQAQEETKKKQQEEEEMTPYNTNQLEEDWEFKIVRSQTNAFKKYDTIERVKAEESIAGWILVEKFDDGRLRFKRPPNAKKNDYNLPQGIDPYRTTYGMGEGGLIALILGGIAAGLGVVFFLLWVFGAL